ncbi:MAG: cysteine desulfurase family protein [Evtepia sp.]|uniref:cysteine desulfurase family protein n=1 Tax=Evtepia sp. TaxID=2773933 RepID=UPI002A750391|nr:cysteine desulfurase family protein [Evtepia sp.]MDY3015476.1 cysteine desulfurase family protein [Evtepia sp.]
MNTIYLDHAATTPVLPEAAQAALEAMTQGYGNPSSLHFLGTQAAKALTDHRAQVADALGCAPEEVFFTSCGTEGDNWAISMAAHLGRHKGKHIITTAIEHSAVLEPCKALEQQGYSVTYLRPDRSGHVSLTDLEEALRPDTVLVSMMLVNNETGAVQPVAQAAQLLKAKQSAALLHTDAVQGFLKLPFTPKTLGADLVTISGHKIGAPKGIGALYIRKGLRALPLIRGGGQEQGLRSGTEPTAQIAAFAAACRLGKEELTRHMDHLKQLSAYARETLPAAVQGLVLVSPDDAPHICALSLPGYPSQVAVRYLSDQGICVSSGSACHRGKASHVYTAMNLPKPTRDGMLRISFGPSNTKEDIDQLAQALRSVTEHLVAAGR